LIAQAAKRDVVGYYAGRMLCDVLPIKATLDKITPVSAAKQLEEARKQDQGKSVFPLPTEPVGSFLICAMASSYAEPLNGQKELDLILNGLVSSISGIIADGTNSEIIQRDGLQKLATLNTMCQSDESFWSRVKEFRIVMLVKTVLNWPGDVTDPAYSWILSTEILRLMRSLLPFIQHIEGEFWGNTMKILENSLEVVILSKLSC
jgi:hypothetical protein